MACTAAPAALSFGGCLTSLRRRISSGFPPDFQRTASGHCLFQGYVNPALRAPHLRPLWRVFAYFLRGQKVGRARRRETFSESFKTVRFQKDCGKIDVLQSVLS